MPDRCLGMLGWTSMLPKVIDLFSGCGGLALGFEKAGFDVVAGIELMPEACQTISYNLDYRYGKELTHLCGDITEIDAGIFKNKFGNEGCVVIGGPPCQAYSLAGRAKLKSLGIDKKDTRGFLYQDFLRFVYGLDAKAAVMENVPESVNFGGLNIPELVCMSLDEHGYDAKWTILNAADYGVPQIRERIILFAVKRSLNKTVQLPEPTHRNRKSSLTRYQKRFDSFSKNSYFSFPNSSENASSEWVTVGEAFSDLPVLFPDAGSRYRNVKLNEVMDYRTEPQNDFQFKMRNWYGNECYSLTANSFRNNKRDFAIFERMHQGDNYIDASKIADDLFEREAKIFGYETNSVEYCSLKRKMVPVYDREKFCDKWKRLEVDRPSHTVVAHLSMDTYSHIHPTEPRGISVREAARIQSFPDDFFFSCSMGDAFKQIGNAVPPLLAYSVAQSVYSIFNS